MRRGRVWAYVLIGAVLALSGIVWDEPEDPAQLTAQQRREVVARW